jgi:hypothetical protein
MKIFKIIIPLLFAATTFFSCKKESALGGSVFNANVNMSTYDYLKTNRSFDTLVLMIDKMQLKEEVNSSGTFFAMTNYSIHNFVQSKQAQLRVTTNDENLILKFDDLNFSSLKDSLRAYMFKDKFTLDNLTQTGVYASTNDGEKRLINKRPTTDYTSPIFTTNPQYIYLTKVVPLNPSQLLTTLCQTTGIITTTGVLHVLSNNHTFTYFNDTEN